MRAASRLIIAPAGYDQEPADLAKHIMSEHPPKKAGAIMSYAVAAVIYSAAKDGSNWEAIVGGFADIVPAGCTLLAESAVAVGDIDRADLARRIQDAKEDAADAKDDQSRSKAEQFLSQLTTLESAILPA